MKLPIRIPLHEITFSLLLVFGLVAIAKAQSTTPPTEPTKKTVKVEVEVTENGTTSRTVQEMTLKPGDVEEQLDNMLNEIETILEEAANNVEQTDLEITIRRNTSSVSGQHPHYRSVISVMPNVPEVETHAGEPYAFLGVYASGLEEAQLSEYNVEQAVRVSRVVEGSAASDAGLREGDVLISLDGEELGSFHDLSAAIRSHNPGDEVEVAFIRDGAAQTQIIALGSRQREVLSYHHGYGGHNYNYNYHYNSDDQDAKDEVVSRAYLGVKGHNLGAEDNVAEVDEGAYLTSIVENTAADKGGLQAGDVIVEMDGESIASFEQLGKVIRSREAGEEVDVKVIRDGKSKTLKVTLGEHEVRSRSHSYSYGSDGKDMKFDFQFDHSNNWTADGMKDKPMLGVIISNTEEGEGVQITEVFNNSTAQEMGLKSGDKVTALNGTKVNHLGEFIEVIKEQKPGDKIKVEFEREGKAMKKTGTLKSKKDNHKELMEHYDHSSTSNVWERKMRISVEVEELDQEEIRDLNQKAGESLDENNSLELEELSFSPNPNNGQFKVMFDLPTEGDTKIRVFDQNGRSVFTQTLKDFSGIYSNQIDISSEASGVYFVSIDQNGKGMVARVVKQ